MKSRLKLIAVLALASFPVLAATTCENLTTLSLPNTTITSSKVVAPGGFTQEGSKGSQDIYKDLPSFCRVAATLKPSSDSDIKIEVWLPAKGWNGKYQAVGNGGWAGVISYSALADALRTGYAAASTDTGHTEQGGAFAYGHPEKLIDFGWRSEHEMTVKAKSIIQAFYNKPARLSYWNGCSTGGRQGLNAAQRFPDDYDGVIAGAPANRNAMAIWLAFAVLKEPASYIAPAKYPMIHQAVVGACDMVDGLKDGLIDDPTKCKFDPKTLLCNGADGPACLTAAQVAAVQKIYTPGTNPRTGQELFKSLAPGTELAWNIPVGGPTPNPNVYDHFKYVVFKNPTWDWRTFDFDKDIATTDLPENNVMNGANPNMRPFFSRKGKLLMYQGWADTNVAAGNTIKFYNKVVDTLGGESKTSSSMRLFLAPGMGHCRGGEGPNDFDKISLLEQWVEKGKAPDKIVASHSTQGKVDRTRPLCPYPQVAKYKGSGSIDDAANFACAVR